MLWKEDVTRYRNSKRAVVCLEVVYPDGTKVKYDACDIPKVRFPLRRAVVVFDPKDSKPLIIDGDAVETNRVVVRKSSK